MLGDGVSACGQLLWGRDHHDRVIEAVRRAEISVWIATANLKDVHVPVRGARRYHTLLAEFDRLSRDEVELRILHAGLPSRSFRDSFDRFPRLIRGGLALRQCPRVHLKAVIVDARLLYLGSANLTGAGLGAKSEGKRNFELGFLTTSEAAIDQAQARFDRIWSGAACSGCGLRSQCEAPLDVQTKGAVTGKTIVRIRPPPTAPRRRGGSLAKRKRDR